jgi:hypothetical protein
LILAVLLYDPNIVDRSRFKSPNVIGFVRSNRLRYAGHMIRGAEDLPLRVLKEGK